MTATDGPEYTQRLSRLQGSGWKRFAPNPYRWYLRQLKLGRVIEPGCGVGRLLGYLDGNGVGIDHNDTSVETCRERGFVAYSPAGFAASTDARLGSFDALLCAHVIEHLDRTEADELINTYLPFVRRGGRVILITPQERGQRSDATHVRFIDKPEQVDLCARLGLTVITHRSFPLPRFAGRWFIYNESITVARVER